MTRQQQLAENIREIRHQLGWTQADLAGRLFVTTQTVSKWETGLCMPDLDNLCRISECFNVQVDRLLNGPSEEKHYIAIDGGGTKTAFILLREDGTVLRREVLGATNPSSVGMNTTVSLLRQGIDLLLHRVSDVSGIFAGVAGMLTGDNRATVEKALIKAYPRLRIRVDGDIRNVINSVRDVPSGVAVICGTGSVVFGYDGHGKNRLGGWGFRLDQSGSGYDIGRDVLRAALEQESGLAPVTPLKELVEEKIGGSVIDRLDVIYQEGTTFVATFAPVAFAAAEAGDTVAEEILRSNVRRIAALVRAARAQGERDYHVIFAGGLSGALKEALEEELGNRYTVHVPVFSPAYGACRTCVALFGKEGTDFDKHFEESYALRKAEGNNDHE